MSQIPPEQQAPHQDPDQQGQENEYEEDGTNKKLIFNVVPSWIVSFVIHVALIILLALLVIPTKREVDLAIESSSTVNETVENIDLDPSDFDDLEENEEEELTETEVSEAVEVETVELVEVVETFDAPNVISEELSFEQSDVGDLSAASSPGQVSSRTGAGKKAALRKGGGTPESEEAVEAALKWIAKHQLPDGGWSLDHTIGKGDFRKSPNPGELADARTGATALAILPFLGAGNTHLNGDYKKQVQAGLDFLKSRAQRNGRGISFTEPGGTMYSHGLASIVLCEAFAMTQDTSLAPYAQGSIWYIEDVQDRVGGGWRYQPRQQGDTSAVGWQLIALKSAKLSGLNINTNTIRGVEKFLDGVSNAEGSVYGYVAAPTGKRISRATSAVGLLCRMYMGWDKDTPGIQNGVDFLSKRGPSTEKNSGHCNMYYNYYATQVMKHYGGDQWTNWNNQMRDYLIETQGKKGNVKGSWYLAADHAGKKGGRLYSTALATMTLEVYYRFLPIYKDRSAEDDFEL